MSILTKEQQRKMLRERLDAMSYFDRGFKSQLICDDIIRSGIFDEHSHILLYKALPYEVNVDWLIDFAASRGKHCYLPRVCGEDMQLVRYPCAFQKGAFSIMEPIGEAESVNIDLVITPLLGVDKQGNRLGKGKGYYDRFFAKNPSCFKVGVAFSEQVLDSVATAEFDIKLDKIFVR